MRRIDEDSMTPPPGRCRSCQPARPDRNVRVRADPSSAHPHRNAGAVRDLDVAEALAETHWYEVDVAAKTSRINDKIYAAAPGASAQLAAERRLVRRGSRAARHRPAGSRAEATESIQEIVAMIEQLVETEQAIPAAGDVYFRVRELSGLTASLGPPTARGGEIASTPRTDEEAASKEDPRDFALWKSHKAGERHLVDSPWGRGRPGLDSSARRWRGGHPGGVSDHGGRDRNDLTAP